MATASSTIFGGITLSISKEEAKTLAAIGHVVGGNPDSSPRKHVESIAGALRRAGYDGGAPTAERKARSGSLFFADYEPDFIAGKAYVDRDNDVFIRTTDNRWVDHYGNKHTEGYPTRPLKKLN